MISRRLLRTKVMQIYYAWVQQDGYSLAGVDKELEKSVHCTLELYYEVLSILTYIADFAEERIAIAKNKKLPSHEDLHPKMNFVNNIAIEAIRNSEAFTKITNSSRIPKTAYDKILKTIYEELITSSEYQDFQNKTKPTIKEQKQIVIFIINELIAKNPEIDYLIEEYALYWNDDIGFVCSLLEKSIMRIRSANNDKFLIMKEYTCEADKEFGKKLLHKAILNNREYEDLIDHHSKNWDIERIATIDKIIMKLAITEFIHMTTVPVKVSINEYIEISKYYSTKKSNAFINGLLDQIVDVLKKENKIKKEGRGLVE